MFVTFMHRTADSYHQFSRERGRLKAISQPNLYCLLSLGTKRLFTATLETCQCDTRLLSDWCGSAETLVSFTSVIDTRSGRYSYFSCISIVYFAAFAVNGL